MRNFICPVDEPRLTSNYGMRRHPVLKVNRLHAGIDLVSRLGQKVPIRASAPGKVRLVKTTKDGYGKHIIITHMINNKRHETVYAHLDSFSVKIGQSVKVGEIIGVMGNTGIGTGVHLHFEIHEGTYNYANGTYPSSRDPLKYISINNSKRISKTGLNLIKKWEGFYDNAYLCPAKVWTIGYGTTKYADGHTVKKGDKITQTQALKLLEQQVNEHASTIQLYVDIELNQNQFDALASFQYNLGPHILAKDSALARYINAKDWSNVSRVMQLYNKANGKVLQGLVDRRKDEISLFLNGLEEEKVYSSPSLKAEHEVTRSSAARREIIVEVAIKAGYNEVWREKLAEGTITADDVDALATGTLVKIHKQ